MGNIWEFLYQTLTVSIAAAVLLLIKWLLRDKLSPRWQYGVWAVLALRVLWPASTARGLFPPLALWIETLKSASELRLNSAYAAPFEVMRLESVLPWVDSAPRSVTDWLFALYIAGAAATLLWYAARYIRLRSLLKRGAAVDAETARRIAETAEKYGQRPCAAVAVPGLSSAFVCGVFRPVLAVPEGETPDGKVILHELLHLKYRDALQNVFWCCLRALHWCNPLMQYVFDRVGNDMESLCDQRVLERLEGEERREYGGILLEMANGSYARAPGTSSISNGAKNISRRIEAIARFKLYPAGMALVAACTAVALGAALLTGASGDYYLKGNDALSILAAARLSRCTTVAGVLDTYHKGLLFGNVRCLATVAPAGEQEELYYEVQKWQNDTWIDTFASQFDTYDPVFFNLFADGEGGYTAEIGFFRPEYDSEGALHENYLLLPVEVWSEGGGYVARAAGEPRPLRDTWRYDAGTMPVYSRARCEFDGGEVEVELYNFALVDYWFPSAHNLMDGSVPEPDAQYNNYGISAEVTIRFDEDAGIDTGHMTLNARLTGSGDGVWDGAEDLESGDNVPMVTGDTATFFCFMSLYRPEEIPEPPEAIELKLMDNGETLFMETLELEAAG